jgi:hypothetical protein
MENQLIVNSVFILKQIILNSVKRLVDTGMERYAGNQCKRKNVMNMTIYNWWIVKLLVKWTHKKNNRKSLLLKINVIWMINVFSIKWWIVMNITVSQKIIILKRTKDKKN